MPAYIKITKIETGMKVQIISVPENTVLWEEFLEPLKQQKSRPMDPCLRQAAIVRGRAVRWCEKNKIQIVENPNF